MTVNYKTFRKQFRDSLQKEYKTEINSFRENLPKNMKPNSIDNYRTKIAANFVKKRTLKNLGNMNLIMHKNKAELMLETTYDSLYKHGYRLPPELSIQSPKGIIRETLAAASIIESDILQRAMETKKLYVWDPFCGTGTFLIGNFITVDTLRKRNS